MTSQYVWIGLAIGLFFAGLGVGYAVFTNNYNPYAMMGNPATFNQMMGNNPQFSAQYMGYIMQNPQYMNQWMSQNPQYMGQWMNTMMQDPTLRNQMYSYMFQNKDFMYSIMGNQTFQNQYMGPWMMQNPNFQQQITNQGNSNPSNNLGSGMMGSSGMGSGMMGGSYSGSVSYKTVSIKDVTNEINSQPNDAQVSKDDNTIIFSSSNIALTSFAMMGQDAINATGYNPPTQTGGDVFVMDALINPTLVVKSGTQLHITLINLDEDMAHNFVITTSGPPYSTMPMMSNGAFLNKMPILPNEEKQQGYAYEYTDSITLDQSGTYWYVCTYPGHAEEGMYGKIIVK
jgi:rusticyanin